MKKTLMLLGLTLSTLSFAEVRLVADNNIKVTAINGQAVSHSPFRPTQQEFRLQAGTAVVTARYEKLFDISNKDHDVVRSKDITVSAELADNQTYRLSMPGLPERYDDAKEYAKAPKLAILNGNTIISEQAATKSQGGLLSGIGSWFGRSQNAAVTDNQEVIHAIKSGTPASTTIAAVSPADKPTRPEADTLDKFMQLWLNANEEERQKIRQWVQK